MDALFFYSIIDSEMKNGDEAPSTTASKSGFPKTPSYPPLTPLYPLAKRCPLFARVI
jgi:hypothetical protein